MIKIKAGVVKAYIGAMMAFLILFYYTICGAAVETSSETKQKVFRRCRNAEYKIALTFDDGPHPYYTDKILDILEDYDIKATFFVVGDNVAVYPDIIRRIIEGGHEIGNHTNTHKASSKVCKKELEAEIRACSELLSEKYDYETTLFRPPEGVFDDNVKEIAEKLDYYVILWSIDTEDWRHTPPSSISVDVVRGAVSGDIILMHDYIVKNSPTPEALKEMIPRLLAKGFNFVTVSELIENN